MVNVHQCGDRNLVDGDSINATNGFKESTLLWPNPSMVLKRGAKLIFLGIGWVPCVVNNDGHCFPSIRASDGCGRHGIKPTHNSLKAIVHSVPIKIGPIRLPPTVFHMGGTTISLEHSQRTVTKFLSTHERWQAFDQNWRRMCWFLHLWRRFYCLNL
ncbi:MAG: Uncharacterised protein [Candidatus Poseidoniaceae archaeon]|nr:MAG: Uncharacterised protein [Candidatus Poseidoniaceae archaeon]